MKSVLIGKELEQCQKSVEQCIRTPVDQLPSGMSSSYPGTDTSIGGIGSGFSYNKSLEQLLFHPDTWPIVKELTDNKPRFDRGTLAVNTHLTTQMTPLHCAREYFGWQSTRYGYRNGRIFCDTFVIFFYFTDVYPGDGGLIVVPGSHRVEVQRPANYFFPDLKNPKIDNLPQITNITPKAGDVIVISELLTHGALIWKPTDRERRFLILCYNPQYFYYQNGIRDEVIPRLSPETKELIAFASFTETKDICNREVIELS